MEFIAGVDESGRGSLAGPVCAAAVILDPQKPVIGLDDSKCLSRSKREYLSRIIKKNAIAWNIAWVDAKMIDSTNILIATLLAMKLSVQNLKYAPKLVLVDGNIAPELAIRTKTIVQGDKKIPEISAASILAKTARDQYLNALSKQYPNYDFHKHKGYGTVLHLKLLKIHGPCSEHRKTFSPIKNWLAS